MIGIQGIDKVLFTGIPETSTIVVEGDTGVLKTTFVVETIKAALSQTPEKMCLYFSLKDNVDLFKKRLGLVSPYVEGEQILIHDYNALLDRMSPPVLGDNIFRNIVSVVQEYKEKFGEKLAYLVIDPINVLYNHFSRENLRRNLYHFFSNLSDLKTQNWIINEKVFGGLEEEAALPCHFLSDGIIELGMLETANDVIRYVEVQKMRGVNHSLKRFQISYRKNVLKVLGSVYE